MVSITDTLASWAHDYVPDTDDLALAHRSLVDTVGVTLAARDHPVRTIAAQLPEVARWAAVGHVLDFDDLHVESTAHISVVITPTVLSASGDARAYLAGAGVMARLGTMLGWSHYAAGWHATCTAGAPAAAVAAGVAWGLSARQLATAMALAVPGAGGVQTAFGTDGKSLQVGFAAEAGIRAARLARAGATADPRALDDWLELVGGTAGPVDTSGPAVPGGLAIKMFPCCYAMQRPIAALRGLRGDIDDQVAHVTVSTPAATLQPLIHNYPRTGLQGKFSMQYAVAATLLDDYPGFASFTDPAVGRGEAQQLLSRVDVDRTPGGDGLLDGEVDVRVALAGGRTLQARLGDPPGAPRRPPTDAELREKLAACGEDVPKLLDGITWQCAAELLRTELPLVRD
ncbi:MAG: 2-methylcitrate dehydratase [Streptosporangiales bacterium]|nr:2-methylcitrate dehydratase [Streptosporangiales bacterium]